MEIHRHQLYKFLNTLLNDVTLNIENLISETDALINNKSTSIIKTKIFMKHFI